MALDKVVDSTALDAGMTAVADAIRAKAGTADPLAWPDGFAAAIGEIETGGGGAAPPAKWNDVTFIDYDGSVLYSYSLAEAQALTELPSLPTHDGLICQGWNWTLDDIKALGRAVNVGAMYITDDGKTRLHIKVWDTARSNVPLYFSQTVANGVTIDWGDGSETETLAGTGNVNTTHQYNAAGDYTISLSVADGCTLGLGHSISNYSVMGLSSNRGRVYTNTLQAVNIGENVTEIGINAFYNCNLLESITIPYGITKIGGNSFYYCYSLFGVTIPNSVTMMGYYIFGYCHSLSSVAIPNSVTVIGQYAFTACYSLSSVTIPNSVTKLISYAFQNCCSLTSVTIPNSATDIPSNIFNSCNSISSITIPNGIAKIDSNAFYNCFGMAEYHLQPTTPPTLSNTSAFTGIPSDCIIYVPKGSLEAYQSATNWATYADYMQEEPA